MTTHVRYSNGLEKEGGGDNGDKITTNTLLRWLVAVCGTLLTLLFTRWLNHIDNELELVKRSIVEIRTESSQRAESWARMEGKIDHLLRDK